MKTIPAYLEELIQEKKKTNELLQHLIKMNNNTTPILNEQGKKIERRTKKD